MKKTIVTTFYILLGLSFSSFSIFLNNDPALILKSALESNHLEKVLALDLEGKIIPLTIRTNNFISEKVVFLSDDFTVNLSNSIRSKDIISDKNYLTIKDLSIKGNKSILKMHLANGNQKGYLVKMRFEKMEDKWYQKSIYLRGNGEFWYLIDKGDDTF